MTDRCDVAIIGAGPYGLSIAAHLRAKGLTYRIFGTAMKTWRTQMLRDSHLKSDGFASSLYEPSGAFTLKAYCQANGLPYEDTGLPVARKIFTRYALEFQQRYVPDLDQRDVAQLSQTEAGYALRLADGGLVTARRVVVAVGISHFRHVPPALAALPATACTHSSAHHTVEQFAGRDVLLIGAGASSLDMAKELLSVGATVRILSRGATIAFHDPPRPRSLMDRLKAPSSGLGPGWRSRLATDAPLVFHAMPEQFRITVVRKHLGPAPCWFTREAVEGKVTYLMQRTVQQAAMAGDRVALDLGTPDGGIEAATADHVIAATGYRVDLDRLAFLPAEVKAQLRLCDTSPALSSHFESSLPGLYFVGILAANSFGPVSRFAYGAGFTARRLSSHLARGAERVADQFVPEKLAA